MKSEENETISPKEEEPVYVAPKRVSLAADVANIFSWIVLAGYVGDLVVQVVSLRSQIVTQGLVLADLAKEPSFFSYIFTNMVEPLLIGLGLFAVLQAASAGLNMLLEMDLNAREKNKA